jgi:hypothetical protein
MERGKIGTEVLYRLWVGCFVLPPNVKILDGAPGELQSVCLVGGWDGWFRVSVRFAMSSCVRLKCLVKASVEVSYSPRSVGLVPV